MATSTLHRQDESRVSGSTRPAEAVPRWVVVVWVTFTAGAFVAMDWVPLTTRGWAVPVVAAVLVGVTAPFARAIDWVGGRLDVGDLVAIVAVYVPTVGLFRLAFGVFGTDNLWGLFLSFAGGLVLGVAGPVVYTVWLRGRTLRTLGLGVHNLRATLALAVLLAGVQFAMTLWGVALPAPVDWVPLLAMSLVVGLFEAVLFRGFIQTHIQTSFGTVAAVVGAAALYAIYHVGYGMGGDEMLFLFGLGVVYAVAFRLVDNLLVLWPLLTPLGAFFNNLEAGDIELPWASIAGFADVLAVMGVVVWLAVRHQRKLTRQFEATIPGG